jgi:hypothetical protein
MWPRPVAPSIVHPLASVGSLVLGLRCTCPRSETGVESRLPPSVEFPWPPRANWKSWSIQDFIDLGQLRSVRVPIEQTLFCADDLDLARRLTGPLAVLA